MATPMTVLTANTRRETGKKAQFGNIMAAKAVSDIVRTTMGPSAMLKMILDASGGIVITNDGNAILREIDVSHPAAKSVIELSRNQDDNVGDGTTSVIILAGEILYVAEQFLEQNLHPTVIIRGYVKALEDAIKVIDGLSFRIDPDNMEAMLKLVNSCIGTKFSSRFGSLIPQLAIEAVRTVAVRVPDGSTEVDIKKYAKVEKIPGGAVEDSRVLKGVMFQKDVVAPERMRRVIKNPRVLLLDCPLEYKKGENQTNVELTREEDWKMLLKLEEDAILQMVKDIVEFKPDLVITEKGLSDLAMHYLVKLGKEAGIEGGISAIRRLRKTDNNRIARATGATIVHRTEEIRESDIGTKAGLFEVVKIGDEFYSFIVDCEDPKACTILLRGASKDVLNEFERNLQDALCVARNVVKDPRLVPGGGAAEMAVARVLQDPSTNLSGPEQGPYRAIGQALEVIPRTLAQNCGANVIRVVTELRAKHADPSNNTYGINGLTGAIVDMKEYGIWDPYEVKVQTLKTAIEAATLLLRIDDIVSGIHKKDKPAPGQSVKTKVEDQEVDSEQMLPE